MKNLFFLVLFFSFLSELQASTLSCNKTYRFDELKVSLNSKCEVSLKRKTIKGREFIFKNKNILEVKSEKGINTFSLTPKIKENTLLEFTYDQDLHLFSFVTASGLKVEVDTKSSEILNLEGFRLETYPLTKENNIKIMAYEKNKVIDHGFKAIL